MKKTARLGLIVPLLVAITSCSSSGDNPRVTKGDLENQITSTMAEKSSWTPGEVECPTGLPGKVDRQIRCTVVDKNGVTLDAYVTVESVKGKQVHFTIEVDRGKPDPSDKDAKRNATDKKRAERTAEPTDPATSAG